MKMCRMSLRIGGYPGHEGCPGAVYGSTLRQSGMPAPVATGAMGAGGALPPSSSLGIRLRGRAGLRPQAATSAVPRYPSSPWFTPASPLSTAVRRSSSLQVALCPPTHTHTPATWGPTHPISVPVTPRPRFWGPLQAVPLSDWGKKEGGPALSLEIRAPRGGQRPSFTHMGWAVPTVPRALRGALPVPGVGSEPVHPGPTLRQQPPGDAPHAPCHGAQDLPPSFPPDPHARVPGAQVGSGVQGRSRLPHTRDPEAACTPVDRRRGLPRGLLREGISWSLSGPHEAARTRPRPL